MEGAKEVIAAIGGLRKDLDDRHSENATTLGVVETKVNEVIRRVDDLHDAFPGGDWDGHRRYHEAVIKRVEAREKFYQDLRTNLATKGLWALILMLTGMLAGSFLLLIRTKINP
jgi:hypothetical protein